MSLRDIILKNEYRSLTDNVVKDFYIPALNEAMVYKRAVGFFSSSALVEISKGISGLIRNGGKILLVASPYLSEEDFKAIQLGYENRSDVIRNAVIREIKDALNPFEKKRLNLLANLITNNVLDIKIAFTTDKLKLGMYHEKMGIIIDEEGNKIAFSGSMNESSTAMRLNYETIDVFCSWDSQEDQKRIISKEKAFDLIWNDSEPNIRIIEIKDLKKEFVNHYKYETINISEFEEDSIEFETYEENGEYHYSPNKLNNVPMIPEGIALHDYQIEAIDSWEKNGYRGIFDMATGTGKTYAGLGAIVRLNHHVHNSLGVFIICPYQHLIEQWVQDIKEFNVSPLICYSAYDWKRKFKSTLNDFKLGITKSFYIITTNVTFASNYFQKEVDKLSGNICLVVDEAHNFGSKKQLNCMKEIFRYRLALSATLERHHDEDGTQKLKNFFGEKCIEYSLERAIKEDKLTPYYYYPIPISLCDDELEEYNLLTEKIVKILQYKNNKDPIPQSAEMLLIKRARVIAGARNKLKALYEIIKSEYRNDNNMLIYCGATTIDNSNYIEGQIEEEEKRQIDLVVDMLGNKLGMRVSKFTSEENSAQREVIKTNFSEGKMLQALVAIRCLDEGMNIPGIKTAFILASSTNPKEYIQRRGRVLRKARDKPYAKIYDFITLPRNLDEKVDESSIQNSEYSLLKREASRMEDFASLAENSSGVAKLQKKIDEFYKLNYFRGLEHESN
ncbi:MAG: DEAD/DEAH box helicase family protein [Dethiosulfatibacter sp.]|nr:DEAD/DEAH box helicase family protein [Dethiosulfatibacter sp.]